MSLINNMLKELEKREKKLIANTCVTPIQYQNRHLSKKTKLEIFISSTIVISILLSIFFLVINPQKKPQLIPVKQSPTVVRPLVKKQNILPSELNTWLQPGLITGITLQVKDNITEISFLLNHPILYRINTHDMSNELSIIFYQSRLEAPLPPAGYLNTALENITSQLTRGDTQFNLRFSPNSTIKYINLNSDGKNSELIIAIESSQILSNHPNQTTAIKKPALQTMLMQQYQSALNFVEQGLYQEAIGQLISLLKADPQYQKARTTLAAIFLNQGKLKKSLEILDEGLELSPDHAPFIELKARILVLQGKNQQALDVLHYISPSIKENPEYHALLAALYERNNDDFLAVKLYQQLTNLNPRNGNWWLGLGISLEKLNQKKSAMNAYEKAVEVGHLNPNSNQFLQQHLTQLQDLNNANEKG